MQQKNEMDSRGDGMRKDSNENGNRNSKVFPRQITSCQFLYLQSVSGESALSHLADLASNAKQFFGNSIRARCLAGNIE
jgi:hypothetical protein